MSGSVTDIDDYRRFTAVDAVRPTVRGLRATLGGEHLDVDAVREDVVRIRMSRGGVFDDPPRLAVVAEPLEVEVSTEVGGARGRGLARGGLVVRLGLDPFTVTVTRTDGTPVLRTAEVDGGVVGLRHPQRRVGAAAATSGPARCTGSASGPGGRTGGGRGW